MTRLASLLLMTAIATAAGCTTQRDTSPFAGRRDTVAAPANNPRIVTSSSDLMQSLGFDEPIVVRRDDLLTVSVPTRNLGSDRYLLDYRFVWYDKDGMELRPAMGWREVVIEPRDQKRIAANAIDSRAVDWKIQLHWANR